MTTERLSDERLEELADEIWDSELVDDGLADDLAGALRELQAHRKAEQKRQRG